MPGNAADWLPVLRLADHAPRPREQGGVLLAAAAPNRLGDQQPGLVWEGGNDGKLRAYSARDGRVLWNYGTIRDFTGVNGLPGRGGTISGGGGGARGAREGGRLGMGGPGGEPGRRGLRAGAICETMTE